MSVHENKFGLFMFKDPVQEEVEELLTQSRKEKAMITYCLNRDCVHWICKRHQCHIKDPHKGQSYSDFDGTKYCFKDRNTIRTREENETITKN